MTTIYRNRGRKGPPYLVPAAFLGVIVLCVVVILLRGTLASIFWRIGVPLSAALSAAHLNIGATVGSKVQLARENELLRAALASSTAALLDRDVLYRENLELKGRQRLSTSALVATIVMRPPATPYDTLILDAGAGEGIARGDIVSGGGGSTIGTITDVYATASRATLYSAPGTSYEALLRTQDGKSVPISVEGQGGGSMTAQVPVGTNTKVGDLVVFPGLAMQFAGSVSAVAHTTNGSFDAVYFHLPVNIFELTSVTITRSPATNAR